MHFICLSVVCQLKAVAFVLVRHGTIFFNYFLFYGVSTLIFQKINDATRSFAVLLKLMP